MSISANGKLLAKAAKELSARWSGTRESWRDPKSEQFEREYLTELLMTVERSAPVFDQLDKLLAKIRRDCE
jgi:hypothetical protein